MSVTATLYNRSCAEADGVGDPADATAHIPEERRGILGTLSAEQLVGLRAHLAKRLGR